jgi:hypothetical protein
MLDEKSFPMPAWIFWNPFGPASKGTGETTQNAHKVRYLSMFNLAIDSKLRGCDLVNLRFRDITHGNQILARAMVVQRKTQRPVQFELTEPTSLTVS